MPIGQLVGFAVWLGVAMLGAVLIVFVWEWLRAKYGGDIASPSPPGSGSGQDA